MNAQLPEKYRTEIKEVLTEISEGLAESVSERFQAQVSNVKSHVAEIEAAALQSVKNSALFHIEMEDKLINMHHQLQELQTTEGSNQEVLNALHKSVESISLHVQKSAENIRQIAEEMRTEIRLSDTKTHELQQEQFNIILEKITETKSKDNLQLKLEELKEKQQTYFRNMSIAMAIILIITLTSLVMQWS